MLRGQLLDGELMRETVPGRTGQGYPVITCYLQSSKFGTALDYPRTPR